MLALVVKVSERELSDEVSPSLTSEAVIVMDGVPGKVVVVVVVVVVVATADDTDGQAALPAAFLVNSTIGLFED